MVKMLKIMYLFLYLQCFTFDLQYVQTGFKSYECRAENDDGHH